MRRLIAIVLMFLLPLQSAWALVAMPCRGYVDMKLPHAVQALAVTVQGDPAVHHGDALDDGHHGLHALHDGAAASHEHHAHHNTLAAADHHPDGGSDGNAAKSDAGCSGSAACMSLHSPPLAAGFDASLPALQLPSGLRPAEGTAFSSVPPAREHRPPIGRPA